VIKRLRDAGLSLQVIRCATKEISKRISTDALHEVLIADGKRIYWCRKDGKIQDVLRGDQLVFTAVALRDVEKQVRAELKLPAKRSVSVRRRKRA
jgi:hypothetical protein